MNQLAATLSSAISSVPVADWSASITVNIQTMYSGDGLSSPYAVAVISVTKPIVAEYVPPKEEASSVENRTHTLVVLLSTTISTAILMAVVATVVIYLWYRRRQRQANLVDKIQISGCSFKRHKSIKKFDYYLSYSGYHSKLSSQPETLAMSIHDELAYRGFQGYFPDSDQKVSEEVIEDILVNCAAIVVCLHDQTCHSWTCCLEWKHAERIGIPALCIADLQNCNKQMLEQQVFDVSPHLLKHPWQDYVLSYRRDVYEEVAEFIERQNRSGVNNCCMDPVLPCGSVIN